MIPKTKPYRNKAYLRWVVSNPCCVCGTDNEVQSHHIIGHGTSGMALKSDDRLSCSLCHTHHVELHIQGHQTFDAKYRTMNTPAQLHFVNLTLGRARIQKKLTPELIVEARELIK